MVKKIKVGSGGIITLCDKSYLAAGGEGEIYVNGGMAYKLYHDPVHKMLPFKKIQELSTIFNTHVITPQEIIYDPNSGNPLGYTTKFVDGAEPLLKFFTKTFKDDNNVSPQMINRLVKEMQLITTSIHTARCLVVDYNELNVLVKIDSNDLIPFYIDTDSYATPSFKATAVMDSIRDRKVSYVDKNKVLHYNPTIESDWFSWSILAFWLYSNIHVFRGAHPNYKPRDKTKQMDDGISVFHPNVRVPSSANDFNVIPPRHLDWFKRVFLHGERGVPPLPDSTVPLLVPSQIITIQGTDKLGVNEIHAYSGSILDIQSIMGVYYVATKTHIYANHKEVDSHNAKKINLCSATDGTLIVARQDFSNKITFHTLTKAEPIGTATSNGLFYRNNAFYTIVGGKLIENTFRSFNSRTMHVSTDVENVSANSAKIYDGCVIQDLLGKQYLALPYKQGSCFSRHIQELDGYRIVGAKAEKNIVVIIGEKRGQFDRFILIFDKTYNKYDLRKVEDITYDTINFTVMDNGLCILLSSPSELELFVTANQVETLQNPPFDSTMKLFSTSNGIFFINGNSFHQLKKK
jgi:hypothetical protein